MGLCEGHQPTLWKWLFVHPVPAGHTECDNIWRIIKESGSIRIRLWFRSSQRGHPVMPPESGPVQGRQGWD